MYSGILHAIDPQTLSIIIQNFIGVDERAEFKVINLSQMDYFTVAPSKS